MEGDKNMPRKVADIPSVAIPDAKMEELSDAVKDLVEASTRLVIKLAVCECDSKNCPLLTQAKAIAKAIDKLQTITPPA